MRTLALKHNHLWDLQLFNNFVFERDPDSITSSPSVLQYLSIGLSHPTAAAQSHHVFGVQATVSQV